MFIFSEKEATIAYPIGGLIGHRAGLDAVTKRIPVLAESQSSV
jgi:hypothetical protein